MEHEDEAIQLAKWVPQMREVSECKNCFTIGCLLKIKYVNNKEIEINDKSS